MSAPASTRSRRRLILLGSTGSIGTNTLEVVRHLRERGEIDYEVAGLAAGQNIPRVREQAESFAVPHVAIATSTSADELRGVEQVYHGPDAALEMVREIARPGDLVVGAMVGAAGIPATLAALERGCDVALANKETLVAAGGLVMPLVRTMNLTLLPIDSEHSAIFQCLLAGRSPEEVHRVIITASGGPFRTWDRDRIARATIDDALNHPTWNMGRKVTIDSASLMNKALEVIEAHWLFDLPAEKIDVLVHPQSIVHSLVEFKDGSVIAQLGAPDMKTPIQYALTWPRRAEGCSDRVDWRALRQMDFEPVDHDRFGALRLAYDVIRAGGTAGAIFNAANEAAVNAFLAGRIPFSMITELVEAALAQLDCTPVTSLNDVFQADRAARDFVDGQIARSERPPLSAAGSRKE